MSFREKANKYRQIIFGQQFYLVALILLAIGLPVAPFLVSVSQFLLGINWLLEGKFKHKWDLFKQNKALGIFLIIFAVHLVWLLNTNDFRYAFHDIKIKIPLFFLPVIIGTSSLINKEQLKKILLFFSATVVTGALICFVAYAGNFNSDITDARNISLFISHIRFGLMIVFAIFILGYYFAESYNRINWPLKLSYILSIVWLVMFLFILQSVTSWVLISILTYVVIIVYYKKMQSAITKVMAWVYLIGSPSAFIVLMVMVLSNFVNIDVIDKKNLPSHTKQGSKYIHYTESKYTENGHYVWLYYSYYELKENWPKYSEIPFEGKDAKGQSIKHTLIRYLTSKNLTKDAEGLKGLDKEDIEMIEVGCANCIYKSKITPYVKLYELVWELNQYYLFGNPNAKTVSMRIEYSKAGINIFKNNYLFGVGTGDVKNEFANYYEQNDSKLKPEFRRRGHNQYLTFALTFGIIGFVLIMFAFIKPVLICRHNWSIISLLFLFIIVLSMINEDTLETQSGATFSAFFYSLLILRAKEND